MKINSTAICVAICLSFPLNAFALDQSVSVKITQILKTTNSWDGKPIVYPDGKAEITGLLVEIGPGGETGWHLHHIPSFGMVLEGTLGSSSERRPRETSPSRRHLSRSSEYKS
jgi:quercetin dioxygenase-like cupin family protein